MTTASYTTYLPGIAITCEIEARGSHLDEDAAKGARAACAALRKQGRRIADCLPAMREEFRQAMESGSLFDAHQSEYRRLVNRLDDIAYPAATMGWYDPSGAVVTIDLEPTS